MIPASEQDNFEVFRDCLSTAVIDRLAPSVVKKKRVKGRKNEIKPVAKVANGETDGEADAVELSDFTEVRAQNRHGG